MHPWPHVEAGCRQKWRIRARDPRLCYYRSTPRQRARQSGVSTPGQRNRHLQRPVHQRAGRSALLCRVLLPDVASRVEGPHQVANVAQRPAGQPGRRSAHALAVGCGPPWPSLQRTGQACMASMGLRSPPASNLRLRRLAGHRLLLCLRGVLIHLLEGPGKGHGVRWRASSALGCTGQQAGSPGQVIVGI